MPRRGRGSRARGSREPASRRRRTHRRDARQRRQSVPALADRRRSPTSRRRSPRRRRASASIVTSGPSEARRGRARHRRRAGTLADAAARAGPVVRRVLARRTARAGRSRRALHRRRQRADAHRRHQRACRSCRCTGRRCRRGRRPGAQRRPPAIAVEVTGLAVPPVRPARLRARRLPVPHAITPEQVIEAADAPAASGTR